MIIYISSNELAKQTGASYRQIDYWCRYGVIHCEGEDNPGSGQRRQFDAAIVPAVRLLADIGHCFGSRSIHVSTLKRIYKAYPKGDVNLGKGIVLSWKVE